jgi:hypothetical protein
MQGMRLSEGALFVRAKQTEHPGLISSTSVRREGDADVVAVLGALVDPVDSSIACHAQCHREAGCDAVILMPGGRCQLLLNLVIV